MELVREYLEEVQKINGVWILRIPAYCNNELVEQLKKQWQRYYPGENVVILPEDIKITKANKFSFYIALMIVRGYHGQYKVTRVKWLEEYKCSDKSEAPYLTLETHMGKDYLILKFPNDSNEDEFYFVTSEDMDADDYILV